MAGESGKRRKRSRKVKPDNPAQSKRFIEAAKALGVDEDGETFGRVLDAMLKPKPKPKPKGGGSN
jgi:hypothetical protein